MKAFEIFQHLSPALASQLFTFLHESEKPTYRVALQTLAAQRKLRPVFIERKPRPERHAWLQAALSRPAGESIASNLMQMWLMGAHASLICDFLDALGIEHDPKGGIETLPPSPPADQLRSAVDGLLARHPAEVVAAYLHSFQAMEIAGWPALGEILANDERLRFNAPSAAVPAVP